MKTAISVPDSVFLQAEKLASRMKISRSKLYVIALQRFIDEQRQQNVTEQINAFISQNGQPVDDVFLHAGLSDFRNVEW